MRPFSECNRGLLGVLRTQRGPVLLSALIGLVGVVASLLFVWVSKKVVDIATGASPGDLQFWVFTLLGIMLVQVLCRVGGRYWEGFIVVRAQNSLRRR